MNREETETIRSQAQISLFSIGFTLYFQGRDIFITDTVWVKTTLYIYLINIVLDVYNFCLHSQRHKSKRLRFLYSTGITSPDISGGGGGGGGGGETIPYSGGSDG